MKLQRMTAALCAGVMLTAGGAVTAYAAESDAQAHLTYSIGEESVTITGFDNLVSEVVIPAEIEELPVTAIADSAFKNATMLENIKMPDSITEISGNAFSGCSSLLAVDLPDSLTTLGEGAFQGCISMQSAVLPVGLKEVGSYAFYKCASLTELEFPAGMQKIGAYAVGECGSLENVVIGKGPASLPPRTFLNCTKLERVSLPTSVLTIENEWQWGAGIDKIYYDSFYGCDNLQHIYYAGSEAQWSAVSGKEYVENVVVHYGITPPEREFDADLNSDGAMDSKDAAILLQYAAYVGAGGTDELGTFIENM